MKKVVLFAFNGDPMCFIHVLLNAMDLAEKGMEGRIVIEGAAVKLVPEISKEGHPLHALYIKAKDKGLIDGVCLACSVKLEVKEAVETEGLKFLDDMSGHAGVAPYLENGFEVITFG